MTVCHSSPAALHRVIRGALCGLYRGRPRPGPAARSSPPAACGAGAYAAVAHNGSPAPRQHVAAPPARPAPPPPPLRLLSVSPPRAAGASTGRTGSRVTFNQPLPASAPLPRLSPAVAGAWQREGDAAVFTPQPGIPAGTRETVMVSAGDGPVRSEQKLSFTTAAYSTLRLQEMLAQLGYLPLSWTPAAGAATPDETQPGRAACRGVPAAAGDVHLEARATRRPALVLAAGQRQPARQGRDHRVRGRPRAGHRRGGGPACGRRCCGGRRRVPATGTGTATRSPASPSPRR